MSDNIIFQNMRRKTITMKITGRGWQAVRTDHILEALLERDIDPGKIEAAWKTADLRVLYVTFSDAAEADKAASIGELAFSGRDTDINIWIQGHHRIVELRLHWVPAWIDPNTLKTALGRWGVVRDFQYDTAPSGLPSDAEQEQSG